MSNLEKHLITKKESDLLASEYEKTNYGAINSKRPANKPDARHFSYDLEVLQDYINLIREEMGKRGVNKKGIRVTLGKYPDNNFDPRLDPICSGYQTIFFSAENMDSAEQIESVSRTNDLEDLPQMNYGQIRPPY
ncbi:hypothetical protein [Kaistella antarctica]|nr:hypothetical protein [Kaistella antarctica]